MVLSVRLSALGLLAATMLSALACSTGDSAPGDPPETEPVAQSVEFALTEVALFQGTKTLLGDADGNPRPADSMTIVRGRRALVRAISTSTPMGARST